jgi:cytochrome c oxidase subunit 3
MNAASTTIPHAGFNRELPSPGHVAMLCLIIAEAAIFTIFVVAYIFYIGKSLSGPTPKEVLSAPIFFSICLLSSSVTIHFAVKAIRQGNMKNFKTWWGGTIVLGVAFLYGTATEWHRLIYVDRLTISTNLFGTTYYSLVGLHGFHVIVGLIFLCTVMVFTFLGNLKQEHAERVDVLSLYWHFVDGVWVVVFTVVYIIGR